MEKVTIDIYIKNEIVYSECKGVHILDLPSAKLLSKTIKNVRDEKLYPVIIDFEKVKYMDKETREFFFNSMTSFSVLAFVTSDIKLKMLLNSVQLIHSSQFLFKVFNSNEKAEIWVKQFIKNELN